MTKVIRLILGVGTLLIISAGCTLNPKKNAANVNLASLEPPIAPHQNIEITKEPPSLKPPPLALQESKLPQLTKNADSHFLIPFSERLGYVLINGKEEASETAALHDKTKLPPIDVWERIARGFKLPEKEHKKVQPYIRWYSGKQDYINRLTERARPYLYYIVESIEARGIPTEIALLPIVESAFQPFAYSSGRAAGIWQFIPSTGKYFGLEQNWWYDGRRDVYRATQAALDYLEKLNKEFDGDWLLALAAYNTGENNLRRAIKKNQRLGKKTDFWSLSLPKETRGYVPKLLAIAEVLGHADTYGIRFKPIPNKPYWAKVSIDSQLDLAKAAEYASVSIEEIYRLNPGINRWATPPGKFNLMLPEDRVSAFQEKYALTAQNQRVSWERHKVRRGETLSHIANNHHITVKMLKEFNHLKSSRIHIGKALIVPIANQEIPQYSLSDMQRKLNLLNQYAPSNKRKLTHTIRSGDTLWDLSKRYNTSIKTLASWNKISPKDTLNVGQRLVIWKNKPHPEKTATVATLNHSQTIQKITYTVRRGDSLARISKNFRIKIAQLIAWNAIKKANYMLHPGQKLTLYVDITRQSEG